PGTTPSITTAPLALSHPTSDTWEQTSLCSALVVMSTNELAPHILSVGVDRFARGTLPLESSSIRSLTPNWLGRRVGSAAESTLCRAWRRAPTVRTARPLRGATP